MTDTDVRAEVICPYHATCGLCDRPLEHFRVVLNSGDFTELENVVNVELTASEIIVTCREGDPASFPRTDVYFAGCSLFAVPFAD